jgi:hypothetical protein
LPEGSKFVVVFVTSKRKKRAVCAVAILTENNEDTSVRELGITLVVYHPEPLISFTAVNDADLLKLELPKGRRS